MNIGYACKHQVLGSGNKKMTYKKLSTYSKEEQKNIMYELSKNNLMNVKEILLQNIKDNIFMFRFSSGIFPMATHPKIVEWWNPIPLFKKQLMEIGEIINNNNIRVSVHPGQFTILTNTNPDVTENAFNELIHSYNILHSLKLNVTPDIVIHVGGKYGDMKKAVITLINNFNRLPQGCKDMIRFENDQNIYTVQQTYHICKFLNIPMILDIEHHKYNTGDIDLETAFYLFLDTWKDGLIPKIHLSSQLKSCSKHAHADFIEVKDFLDVYKFKNIANFDIMLECKKTNIALNKLKNDLKLYNIDIER